MEAWKHKRILIVEDEDADRMLLSSIYNDWGVSCFLRATA